MREFRLSVSSVGDGSWTASMSIDGVEAHGLIREGKHPAVTKGLNVEGLVEGLDEEEEDAVREVTSALMGLHAELRR